jgi:hypothetical protein
VCVRLVNVRLIVVGFYAVSTSLPLKSPSPLVGTKRKASFADERSSKIHRSSDAANGTLGMNYTRVLAPLIHPSIQA